MPGRSCTSSGCRLDRGRNRLLVAGVADPDQAIERVVAIGAQTVTGIVNAVGYHWRGRHNRGDTAIAAVPGVGFQAPLLVELVLAEQQALSAGLLAVGKEGVCRQARAIEVNGRQRAARAW